MKESTGDGQVKFCFADANGNLKIKFKTSKNLKLYTFQSFLAALERKIENLEDDEYHDETEVIS